MGFDWAPPRSPIDALWNTTALSTYDPLADGFLMLHQKNWIADTSDLKVGVKGRRTGITFAEAYDDVTIAAAARSAGGDDVWYIGDTKDKGREFINTCANFARIIAGELLDVEDFMFDDLQEDGTTKQITAWRITFASGFRICALSSNPANIRGLQGVVVIDEAAFHRDVAKVLDACLALLIWGGRIRIISTHNGRGNAFCDLIKEIREGVRIGSIHTVPFDLAVANGLYERVWSVRGRDLGWELSPAGKATWYAKVRKSYGSRRDAMREELDVIPREGDGTMIPLSQIEACQTAEYPLVRWKEPEARGGKGFVDWPEFDRRDCMQHFLDKEIRPLLDALPKDADCGVGEDFAMRQDRTSFTVGYTDARLVRRGAFILELPVCPYDQQKQALYYICDFLRDKRRLRKVVLDANGNGMVLAQEARQRYGTDRVIELMPTDKWLTMTITPLFAAAFVDRTILLPLHKDVRDDIHQFRLVNGVGKIPTDVRTEGTDGGRRHADTAVSTLNFFAATFGDAPEYGYQPAAPETSGPRGRDDDDFDDDAVGTAAQIRRSW